MLKPFLKKIIITFPPRNVREYKAIAVAENLQILLLILTMEERGYEHKFCQTFQNNKEIFEQDLVR